MKIHITLDCPTLLPYQRDDLLAAVRVLARSMGGEVVAPIDGLEYAVDDYWCPAHFPQFLRGSCVRVAVALTGKPHVHIDVLCWSREVAIGYQGEDFAARVYDADPDASVHDRIRVTAEAVGSVATPSRAVCATTGAGCSPSPVDRRRCEVAWPSSRVSWGTGVRQRPTRSRSSSASWRPRDRAARGRSGRRGEIVARPVGPSTPCWSRRPRNRNRNRNRGTMTITKRNRLIRRHVNAIAERDGMEATHEHCRDMEARDDERGHGQHCCSHAYEDAARNTYHHLASRRAYRAPTGRVHLAVGLPAIQRMLGIGAVLLIVSLGACVESAPTRSVEQESVTCGPSVCRPYTAAVYGPPMVGIWYGIDPAADAGCFSACGSFGHCVTGYDDNDFNSFSGLRNAEHWAEFACGGASGMDRLYCEQAYVMGVQGQCSTTETP